MAKQFLPTMQVAYPVESINRKLALRREVSTTTKGLGTRHDIVIPGKRFIGGMVKTNVVPDGKGGLMTIQTQKMFVRKYGRSTPVTANEVTARVRFTKAIKGANACLLDITQITRIDTMWDQAVADPSLTLNGVSAAGYTHDGWVKAVQYAGLKLHDHDYNENQFPNSFDS